MKAPAEDLMMQEKKARLARAVSEGDFDPYSAAIIKEEIKEEEAARRKRRAAARQEKIENLGL